MNRVLIIIILGFLYSSIIYSEGNQHINELITDGENLLKKGDLDGTIERYEMAAELDPTNFIVHLKLGECYEYKNKIDRAKGEYEKAIILNPKDAEIRKSLAYIFIRLRNYNRAEKETKIAIKLKPDFATAHILLGYIYNFQNRRGKAIDCFKKAINLEPENPDAHLALGESLCILGDLKGAKNEYQILKSLNKSKAKQLADMLYPIENS